MSEFSHVLGSNPQTGAIPQVVVDWLAENLPDSGTSGTVTSVNGVEPDESGNVTIEAGDVSASLDPTDPTGLTLLLRVPSTPSVALSLTTSGFVVTAAFTGSSPDGLTLTYRIDWGDGQVTNNAASPASHTYPSVAATHTVTITVTDSEGNTATDSASVAVAPADLSPYGAQVWQDGPVIYYPMDDLTFPPTDYTGTSTAAKSDATGTVTSEAIHLGDGARSVRSHNGSIGLGKPAVLNSLPAWTIEAIVRQTINNPERSIVNRVYMDGETKKGLDLEWNATGIKLRLFGTPIHNTPPTWAVHPSTNDTLHVAATYDGATARLYVNGTEAASAAISGYLLPPASTPTGSPEYYYSPVGDWEVLRRAYSYIAGLAFYDKALSPARIAAHSAARTL